MSPILVVILIVGALLSLSTGVVAFRAGVRAFAAQARLRRELASELTVLSERAGELEKRTSRLEKRLQELPVKAVRVQENLGELRVLSGNLYVTLAQARRILSYSGIKGSGTSWLSKTVRRRLRA